MAATDIFNPNPGIDADLGFNANWNYGSPRKTAANYATQRPRWGSRVTRSVGNGGYTFNLVFVDRPIEQVRYIRRFYEQFQQGFFTLIDHDNNGREHVGNFTSYSDDTETANVKYTVRVTFEDMPGAPMRNYPQANTFDQAVVINAVDDWWNPRVATSGSYWGLQLVAGGSTGDPAAYQWYDAVATAGDFAQVEYVGWGFELNLVLAGNLGIFDFYVDGFLTLEGVDLSTGACTYPGTPGAPEVGTTVSGSNMSISSNLPLDRHRVKFVATGTKNAASSSTSIYFPRVTVVI